MTGTAPPAGRDAPAPSGGAKRSLDNDRLLRALRREPVDRTPVWLMRQAGRYLPEYRETRARAGSFMRLCSTPDLACEVTLQPLARFGLDAAILFSDILTIPDAMGLELRFEEGEGPRFERPVRTAADVTRLGVPDPEGDLGYVMDAVRTIRGALGTRLPLIGFAGSPWTLGCYMVEGGSSRDFRLVKGLVYDDPRTAHRLLGVLADSVALYLRAQRAAGADALMVFDTWGGVLTPRDYRAFSLEYMRQVVAALAQDTPAHERVPVILFTKGAGPWIESIADSGCDGVGIDWTTDLADARSRIGDRVAVQGNMDPCVLFASPERIRAEVCNILGAWGDAPGHVFNLGHGLLPQMDPARVGACVEAVHELGVRARHAASP